MYYAGIGSRETPGDVLLLMEDIGNLLATQGFVLRSGGADGADTAFETGCDKAFGRKEIYIPWNGFNGRYKTEAGVILLDDMEIDIIETATAIARNHHPAWYKLNRGGRALHTRNVLQITGKTLKQHVDLVICWTPNAMGSGGTGQAIRIAKSFGIPVYDLADPSVRETIISDLGRM